MKVGPRLREQLQARARGGDVDSSSTLRGTRASVPMSAMRGCCLESDVVEQMKEAESEMREREG